MAVTLATLLDRDVPHPPGAGDIKITGLTADSREVRPGYVFAALPGTVADGAKFIPQAIERGAIAVISKGSGITAVPEVLSGNPRQLFALMASRFYGAQPALTVAVTGTNGKTSVAAFVRQIWETMGFRAASMGTIGVIGPSGSEYLQHTTPDPMTLHATLARLAADDVDHLALEASSHGLAQFRLDGVRLAAGAFTNITRDHLDYHSTFEDYFDAKMRLFEELLPVGAPAVINTDSPQADEVAKRAQKRGLKLFFVGTKGISLQLVSATRQDFGQKLSIKSASTLHEVHLPLAGEFQASNALVAAGLVISTGGEERLVLKALESLQGAKGRLELIERTTKGSPVFVDYAHTPDALQKALESLRPYVKNKLVVVFGCGGDRDKGKRPEMGRIAAELAETVYVTDDNPRTEDAASIRADILKGCPDAVEMGDRAKAIRAATEHLDAGDVLLVAGKGHELGQILGKTVIPFSDHDAVRAAIKGEDYHG